jgi:cytochrome P450/NAD(P)-dependent dehydrogenase (short-subunit alcohol dehydrogenase family)/3-oxoacyl-(acyl-carrier-protein) synthase
MSHDLDGKIALVTGGARNVGKVIAKRLAADGALVIINHLHSPGPARQTQAEIEQAGGRAVVIRASVAARAQVDRMFDEIESTFGGLDILVNNAANGALVPNNQVTDEFIDRALNTNLKGGLACARRAAALMTGRGGGSIVNLSTLGGGQFVMANYLACGPAKAAVEAMTRYLAAEFAQHGIRVNTAAAGMLESEVAGLFPDAERMQRVIREATPMGRLGRAEEFAEVVAFLASPRSSWVTGQVVLADGGMATGQALLSPPRAAAEPLSTPAPVPVPVAAAEPAPAPRSSDTRPRHTGPQDIDDEIAIVGMGVAVPGANNPDEFWAELLRGAERFVDIPADRWDNGMFWSADKHDEDKTYSKRSAFVTDFVPHRALADELDRSGSDPAAVESTTLWLRHSVLQAMEGVARAADDRCSFLVGYTADGSQHLEEATVRAGVLARIAPVLDDLGLSAADRAAALATIDNRLSEHYQRSGPDPLRFFPHQVGLQAMRGVLPPQTELLLVDTACSSSLYAVDLGIKGLLEGRHDIAVCGGSFAVGPRGSILFAKLNGLSVRGEVRSLDKTTDGVLFSDGAATVVLKRLSKARRDGDRVLATIRSFGSSSDGKGKAIYAPSAAGQKLAIRRALDQPGMADVRPEWIVAHATGTPAGDLAEFTTLRETLDGAAPVYVTSNKSVIGHTGWAAGVASLIEVVLGFQNDLIPPQHRFTEPPADFAIESSNLTIPTAAVPWPQDGGRRRTAAVSGFGFGGTNAHLIVQEPPGPGTVVRPPDDQAPAPTDRIAIVARAVHLPGASAAEDTDSWLRALDAPDTLSFGDIYPLPSFQQVRMPPGMMRAIDRCQLMVLQCAHRLRDSLGTFWEEHRETTGVVLGHLGATRNATLYATRCYLDDLTRALRADPTLSAAPWLPKALDGLTAAVRGLVPPSTEDSFPGMMPNVIPARVANYFDLRGLNMTVDTGFTSALSAIDVAIRYLRQGELSMALVGGINGNSTEEVRRLLSDALDDEAVLAEGSFLLALVTESTATAAGLDILGYLDTPQTVAGKAWPTQERAIECGATRTGRPACFLGAEGAIGVLQALAEVQAGGDSLIVCHGEDGAPDLTVRLSIPLPPAAPAAGTTTLDSRFYDEERYDEQHPLLITRHVPGLVPDPGQPARDAVPFWPQQPTVVVTDRPELLTHVPPPPHAVVLSTGGTAPGTHCLPEVTAEAVRDLLDAADPEGRIAHIRLITDLSGIDARAEAESAELTALHELLFLVVKQRHQALAAAADGAASCVALLLGAMDGQTPHSFTGLFTGLLKVVQLEYPACVSYALVTDAGDPKTGIAQAERESALQRGLPVAYYAAGRRWCTSLAEEPGELVPPDAPKLGPDSVVVAVGGGRGITAELLAEVTRYFRPRVYILGSNRLDAHPAGYLAMSDEEFAKARADYIRRQLAQQPGSNPAQLNRAYERIGQARVIRANLARMARHSGADAVHYLACDVTDRDQVTTAMDRIIADTGGIDLLINAAGLNRSAPIATKSLAEFRQVRDLKLRGYQNLRFALRDRQPRAWCNFGSLLGMTGQVGEADYASGNDFLGSMATYHSQVLGIPEFTVGWTLWGEVGLGAGDLTKAYFEKSGLYSAMRTAEGVHHFIRELNLVKPAPYTIHLGEAERNAVDRLIPGFLTPAPAGFYLGSLLERDEDSCVFERVFDLETDEYLKHHRVNSAPTLPGTFVTEIAFEAASYLLPQLKVFAFEDLRFRHFLKVQERERAAARKKIRAQVVERRPDLDQAVVAVQVTADVVAPNGTVLIKDKPHFEVRVLLAAELPEAPHWEPWHPAAETAVPDPYHSPGSPVLLTDMFVSTTGTRLHPNGKRATYNLRLPQEHPAFSRFRLPTILLDGLARTGVLALVEDDLVPLAAPLGIGRIDVYEHGGDIQVGERYDGIDLYAVLPGANADAKSPGSGNRFVAVRPDSRILLQMTDLDWILMGYINRQTGQFVPPEEAAAMGKAEAGTDFEPVPANQAAGQVPAAGTENGADRQAAPAGRRRRQAAPAGQRPSSTAPGPRGLRTVPRSLRAFQRNAPDLFLELRKAYGDMVRLPLGFFTVHLNYHPDAIRYVLQDNNQNYVRGKGYDAFKIFMGMGLLTLDGSEWRQHRRVVNPLFHKTAIEGMATTMTDATTAVLDRWERQAPANGGIDVVPEMMELTLDALGKVMFDTDLGPDSARVGPAMVTAIEAMVFRGTLPQLTPSVIPIPYNQQIKQARKVMYDVVDRIVEAHRAGRHEGITDLVQLLLSATGEDGEPWARQQIRDEIMTVFMAGHETTGTGLGWALYELASNPDAQERLHEEVERELAGRTPVIGDLDRLPYTRMVVDETLRLHPPIWVYPRDAVEEDEVAGWRIPAKGSVFMVPYVTHRHPDFWVDPERFDPERFSPANTAGHPRYAYFPFGGGQRKCIGNQMAVVQTHLTLAMIAQRFRLRLLPEHPVTFGTRVSFRPLDGIRLAVEPRSR